MQIYIFRKIAALFLCVMFMISFTACNDNSSPVGTWELTAAAIDGQSVDAEMGFIEMELQADGTARLITNGTSAESTWTYKNDALIIDGQTYKFENGAITLNYNGMYMKFTKK